MMGLKHGVPIGGKKKKWHTTDREIARRYIRRLQMRIAKAVKVKQSGGPTMAAYLNA